KRDCSSDVCSSDLLFNICKSCEFDAVNEIFTILRFGVGKSCRSMTDSADDSAIIFKVCHDILDVCISWEIIHCAMSAGKENCVIAFIYQVSESFCLLEKFCHFG